MKFFIATSWRNKEQAEKLSQELNARGYSTYSFLESGKNLLTGQPIEEEIRLYRDALTNWRSDQRIAQIFESEINGLKACDVLILLLPAGDSSHMEAGIAYGLGKKLFLIGAINKPEIVYLGFNKIYLDVSSFLADLPNLSF